MFPTGWGLSAPSLASSGSASLSGYGYGTTGGYLVAPWLLTNWLNLSILSSSRWAAAIG